MTTTLKNADREHETARARADWLRPAEAQGVKEAVKEALEQAETSE